MIPRRLLLFSFLCVASSARAQRGPAPTKHDRITPPEGDEIDGALRRLMRFLTALYRPLDELGNRVDAIRYRNALRTLAADLEKLLQAKTKLRNRLRERPVDRDQVVSDLRDIRDLVTGVSTQVEEMAAGLRASFAEEGNKVANQLHEAAAAKTWIQILQNNISTFSGEQLRGYAERADQTIPILRDTVEAASRLRTYVN